ncbi:M48 family metallopeptidase [Myxococcota bacterium]|nr:M48 family metallopeptidase [Myxococcota bacterium]
MTEASEVRWGTTPIRYQIRRSPRRKTVALTIDGRHLVVTAHPDVPVPRLDAVVRTKAAWVVERLRRRAEADVPARELVSGETVLYRGRQLRLKVVERKHPAAPRMRAGWYEVEVPPKLGEHARRDEVRARLVASLKDHAHTVLPELLRDVCRRHHRAVPALAVRDQDKRWGSCDAKGTLRINWRIIQAPTPLIEYVLAHELVHLTHRAHSPAFWAALGRLLPDYEARRARLAALGPHLTW